MLFLEFLLFMKYQNLNALFNLWLPLTSLKVIFRIVSPLHLYCQTSIKGRYGCSYYHTCFFWACSILIWKKCWLYHMKLICNIIRIYKQHRNQTETETNMLYESSFWPFTIKNGVLNTWFVSPWLTGLCQEVIMAIGTCFSGHCHSGEVAIVGTVQCTVGKGKVYIWAK